MSLNFLKLEFFNNQVADYFIALGILGVGILTIKIVREMILSHFKRWAMKTRTPLDDALILIIEQGMVPLLYLGIFYVAIANLTLHPSLQQVLNAITLIIATFFGIKVIVSIAEYLLRLYWITRRRRNNNIDQALNALIPAIRITVWALGIIFVLDNLGFDISAVVTGLGIGGVAVALASQGILEDLFSYFSILLDRPFELGDFIIIDDFMGTVEHVGIKTTRLQSLSGEEIVMANKQLTTSRIRNYKRMKKRRVLFQFGVTYQTPQHQLQLIPGMIQKIIDNQPNTTFDRAHFYEYGDFSLVFEVVYYVLSSDYNVYMDIQHQINLNIKQEFDRRGIEFAYPTQVMYWNSIEASNSANSDGHRNSLIYG